MPAYISVCKVMDTNEEEETSQCVCVGNSREDSMLDGKDDKSNTASNKKNMF